MSRDLVWLQNYSFAAWGCAACSLITPNLDRTLSGQASAPTRAAFEKHDCKKFPWQRTRVTLMKKGGGREGQMLGKR